jgi:hypothetical protein
MYTISRVSQILYLTKLIYEIKYIGSRGVDSVKRIFHYIRAFIPGKPFRPNLIVAATEHLTSPLP